MGLPELLGDSFAESVEVNTGSDLGHEVVQGVELDETLESAVDEVQILSREFEVGLHLGHIHFTEQRVHSIDSRHYSLGGVHHGRHIFFDKVFLLLFVLLFFPLVDVNVVFFRSDCFDALRVEFQTEEFFEPVVDEIPAILL